MDRDTVGVGHGSCHAESAGTAGPDRRGCDAFVVAEDGCCLGGIFARPVVSPVAGNLSWSIFPRGKVITCVHANYTQSTRKIASDQKITVATFISETYTATANNNYSLDI